jgi:hypothetical protein
VNFNSGEEVTSFEWPQPPIAAALGGRGVGEASQDFYLGNNLK